jgi:hypothetical protein
MITATKFFKNFSWAKIYHNKANGPLLAGVYDADIWEKRFKLHIVFYYDLIQCTSLNPKSASTDFMEFQKAPAPGLPPIFFGDNDIFFNPEDESWVSPKFLKLLFKDLNQGMTYDRVFGDGGEPIGNNFVSPCLLTSSMTPADALAGALVKFFALSIFYLAIVRGHRDIPISVVQRIESQVFYLYHMAGALGIGVKRVLWPKHSRIEIQRQSMAQRLPTKMQPVIDAYYYIPTEEREDSLSRLASRIYNQLKKESPKGHPDRRTVKKYLRIHLENKKVVLVNSKS